MGDRWFDLGNFAVNNELDDEQEAQLLEAYFGEPPDERPAARRSSCSASCRTSARRCGASCRRGVSELDFDFREYAQKHFDRLEKARQRPALRGAGSRRPAA